MCSSRTHTYIIHPADGWFPSQSFVLLQSFKVFRNTGGVAHGQVELVQTESENRRLYWPRSCQNILTSEDTRRSISMDVFGNAGTCVSVILDKVQNDGSFYDIILNWSSGFTAIWRRVHLIKFWKASKAERSAALLPLSKQGAVKSMKSRVEE